nr:MAG TPA: hypothetical protein [Caudoviricetes sp.]
MLLGEEVGRGVSYPPVYLEGNGVIGWVKSHCILLTYDPSPSILKPSTNERRNHEVLHLNRPLDRIRAPA